MALSKTDLVDVLGSGCHAQNVATLDPRSYFAEADLRLEESHRETHCDEHVSIYAWYGAKLWITHTSDISSVSSSHGGAAQTHDTTGLTLWPSAFAICEWLLKGRKHSFSNFENCHVLELGAGCGLPGLLAGQLIWADSQNTGTRCEGSVVLTDSDVDTLRILEKNVADSVSSKMTVPCCVQQYSWGRQTLRDAAGSENPHFDLILGADLYYGSTVRDLSFLFSTLDMYLSLEPSAMCLLAIPMTKFSLRPLLTEAQRAGFVAEVLPHDQGAHDVLKVLSLGCDIALIRFARRRHEQLQIECEQDEEDHDDTQYLGASKDEDQVEADEDDEAETGCEQEGKSNMHMDYTRKELDAVMESALRVLNSRGAKANATLFRPPTCASSDEDLSRAKAYSKFRWARKGNRMRKLQKRWRKMRQRFM